MIEGGNWSYGESAGVFGTSLSVNSARGGGCIGSRPALPDVRVPKITWQDILRTMLAVVGIILVLFSMAFLVMAMNERYGIVPALLTVIIMLMICSSRKE